MKRFFYFFPLACLPACTPKSENFLNEPFEYHRDLDNIEIQSILEFKDHRQEDSLFLFIQSARPEILYELSLAVASVQNKDLSAQLLKRVYQIPFSSVREVVYYAVGQSKSREICEELFLISKLEKDQNALVKLAEAIGKCGRGEELIKFINESQIYNDEALARAIYHFSQKSIYSKESIELAIKLLRSESDIAGLYASNMLARLNGENLINHSEILLEVLNSNANPEIRMNVASSFNKLNGNLFAQALLDRAKDENEDFRVRVNAINSLNYFHYESIADEVLKLLQTENLHLRLEICQFFLNRTKREEWKQIATLFEHESNQQVRAFLLSILLKYAEKDEKEAVNSHLLKAIKSNSDPFVKSFYIRALSEWPENYRNFSEFIFLDKSIVLNSNAMQSFFDISQIDKLESISNYKSSDTKEELISYFASVFKLAILSGDPTLIGYGAKALRNEDVNYIGKMDGNTAFINVAIENLELPKDVETLIDLKKTLAFIEGKELSNEKPPLNHFLSIQQLKDFSDFQYASITTNKGSFEISFDWINAPATVCNFIELGQRGFYDSLRFHRVENNFVVQGGCPRGDGWGSSGESIRSEFAPVSYKTGSLGMASAGKDTESCQWFVTHYPSIHLDGSYTNFASVTKGMTIVNSLAVGDTIYSVQVK